LLKKRVKPLRNLEEAVEDFIMINFPESVSEQRKFKILLDRQVKHF
jgi:hypothetical protein